MPAILPELMSRFGSQYQVSRPTGRCASTDQPLEPGAACVATLCERTDDEGFDRLDFSVEAWDAGERPPGLFSYWRTTVAAPNEQRKILVDDEVLMDLFDRLEEDERAHRIAFRFVLALILMRKRLLRFTGRDGAGEQEHWCFRRRGSSPEDPVVRVQNPHLTDDDVRELTAQLSEILQGDL